MSPSVAFLLPPTVEGSGACWLPSLEVCDLPAEDSIDSQDKETEDMECLVSRSDRSHIRLTLLNVD